MRRTTRDEGKKCRDSALFLPYLRHKALYLCFSSEQGAEAHLACAAQAASKEKSAEMALYGAKNRGRNLRPPFPLEELCHFSSDKLYAVNRRALSRALTRLRFEHLFRNRIRKRRF